MKWKLLDLPAESSLWKEKLCLLLMKSGGRHLRSRGHLNFLEVGDFDSRVRSQDIVFGSPERHNQDVH